ncbi:hypothetical protein GPX89_29700 [Nocardia sp. ET3-3]|uniref:Uncharacterized protein n=1 Tax=Nocardia terrae TaxID=2675851 RepID=A0A7K1V450_9NOCA|nr:hypothetical protein [Nocardia terrae]MVU81405.1 hypothetical protein [Nocardia terrae]
MTTQLLRPNGSFAVYQGSEYRISGWHKDTIVLHAYGPTPPPGFLPRQGHWQLAVPTADLDRVFDRDATFWWRGAHFTIDQLDGDIVEGTMLMDVWPEPRTEFMKRPEMSEDPWEGPRGRPIGRIPVAEIYDVSIREYGISIETGKLDPPIDPQDFPKRFWRAEYFDKS